MERPIVVGMALAVAAVLAGAGHAQTIVEETPVVPPAPQAEVITEEPSAGHVWVPGSWERTPGQWTWVAGHWEQPPFQPARWQAGHWQYDQGKYVWNAGHWASAPVGVVVQKPVAVPPLPVETVPVAPSPGLVWVPGRWEWNGVSWTWYAGYYAAAPVVGATWIPGYWKQGLLGNWRWIEGHWQG